MSDSVGTEPRPAKAPAAERVSGRPRSTSEAKLRSPSTLRHRFRAVERLQADLTTRHDELSLELAASSADHVRLAELAVELQSVDTELAVVEEEWLELASEAEERGLDLG